MLLTSTAEANTYGQWNRWVEGSGNDFVIHSTTGYFVSETTVRLLPDEWNYYFTRFIGVVTALAIGNIIETLDKNPEYSWNKSKGDASEYGAGALMVELSWDVSYDWSTNDLLELFY